MVLPCYRGTCAVTLITMTVDCPGKLSAEHGILKQVYSLRSISISSWVATAAFSTIYGLIDFNSFSSSLLDVSSNRQFFVQWQYLVTGWS